MFKTNKWKTTYFGFFNRIIEYNFKFETISSKNKNIFITVVAQYFTVSIKNKKT